LVGQYHNQYQLYHLQRRALNFYIKNLVKWALTEIESSVAGTITLDRECTIPPDNSIYSNIDMFNDIENTLLDNDLQACLIGDFNAHTGNVSEYVVIDNNILDVLNLQDDETKKHND
jgi:hypothetical protein